MLVNGLTTDLKLNIVHESKTDEISPFAGTRKSRECDLKINTVDQITVTADLACDTLAEISRTIDDYTPPFSVFIGYAPGSRLYLKPENSK